MEVGFSEIRLRLTRWRNFQQGKVAQPERSPKPKPNRMVVIKVYEMKIKGRKERKKTWWKISAYWFLGDSIRGRLCPIFIRAFFCAMSAASNNCCLSHRFVFQA